MHSFVVWIKQYENVKINLSPYKVLGRNFCGRINPNMRIYKRKTRHRCFLKTYILFKNTIAITLCASTDSIFNTKTGYDVIVRACLYLKVHLNHPSIFRLKIRYFSYLWINSDRFPVVAIPLQCNQRFSWIFECSSTVLWMNLAPGTSCSHSVASIVL